MAKDNIFKLVSIDEIPIDFAKIPGLDTEQIDYVSSIGGVNAPEPGATDNSTQIVNNQLIVDVVNERFDTSTKEILSDFTFGASGAIKMITDANNGVWISPTGILGKKAGVTTFAIDISGNVSVRGDVVITGGSGIANLTDAGALATEDTIGVSDCDSTIISGGKIITGLLTANNIQTGTLNASLVTVSNINASNINTGTLTGITINVNGDALRVRDTSGNQVGYMYGISSSIFRVFGATTSAGGGSVTLELDASSGYIKSRALNFHPYNDNESYLGGSTTSSGGSLGSDKTWKYVGAQVVDAKDLYKLNDITVLDQSGTTIYVKSGGGGLVIQDGSTTIATFSSAGGIDLASGKEIDGQYAHLDCVVFANNSPLTENGAIYYNSSDHHFYGRCNGSWRQLDN